MKKNKFLPIFIFSLFLFIFSFSLGYQLMNLKLNNEMKNISKEEGTNTGDKDNLNIEIIKEANRISPNTFVEKRIHYKTCDHLVTELKPADSEIINMDRQEYVEYLGTTATNLRLISYSPTKIVLWGEKNHLCQDHYVIGEEKGNIAIFKIGENGERILDKVFNDYPLTLLIKVDQEKIKEGIIVDSEDELSDILENFIS